MKIFKLLISLMLLFIIVFSITNCSTKEKEKVKKVIPINIKISNAEIKEVTDKLVLKGEIKGIEETVARAPIEGIVENLSLKEGSQIAKGSALMSLNRNYSGLEYKSYFVEAPIGGFISEIYVHNGDLIGPSTNLCKIIQLNKLKVIIRVGEKDLKHIRLYQEVLIKTNTMDQEFLGKIKIINPVLETQAKSADVEIHLDNPTYKLSAGMYVNAEIVLNKGRKTLLVPFSGIMFDGDKSFMFLYVADSKTVKKQEVLLGDVFNEEIEIKKGLEVGQSYVSTGSFMLIDGDLVNIAQS